MAESNRVRAAKLKRYVEKFAAGKQRAFSELVGIVPSNLSLMLNGKRPISDRIWRRIHTKLGIPDETTPEDIRAATSNHLNTADHEGEMLRKWLTEQGIAQKELAEKLGVSTVAVHNYLKTERFRADTLKHIMDVFGVAEEVILQRKKEKRLSAEYLPLVKVGNRVNPNWAELSRVYVGAAYREKGVVFELGHDHLMPPFAPGWQVLGVEIPKEKWKYTTGLVAVMFVDEIQIRRIRRNDIVSHGYVVLESDDPKGDIITVLADDIQQMWTISSIVKGDLH